MKNVSLCTLLAVLVLTSCGGGGFKAGKNGMKYKIISGGGKDSLIKSGELVQYSQIVKFGDSTAQNSYESGNQFVKIEDTDQPFSLAPILKKMRISDSAVVKINCDSLYKSQLDMAKQQGATKEQVDAQMPLFIRTKGNYITLGIKVVKKYATDSLAMIDVKSQEPMRQAYQQKMQRKQMEEQNKKDEVGFKASKADFDKYVAGKADSWKKTPSGALVEILTEGTGEPCAPGKQAELRYTGKLMSNNFVFDSNIKGVKPGDTTTKPVLPVTIGAGGTVKGFDEAVAMMRKGTKAKVYIPSELAYRGQSLNADVPAYSNMIFEIEVVDVKNAPAPPKMKMGGNPQMTPEQEAQLRAAMQKQQQQ